MNTFWKSVAKNVIVGIVVAAILAIPFKQAIVYVVTHIGPQPQVPSGTIVAWYSKSGPVPPGWNLCDGNDGRPDLTDKFLRGSIHFADVGKTGGSETHKHTVQQGAPNINGFQGKGTVNVVTVIMSDANHLPPYYTVVYIIKS